MEVKTGNQLLEIFFDRIQYDKALDSEVVNLLVDLQKEGNLTSINISNGLEKIRKTKSENKINKD
ncbi:MAG: hypothetical protein OXB84_06145 [Halobacteriovoraceae bacterium]|nr:hypothetical protein [Halobacteriovoraceae bacterium]